MTVNERLNIWRVVVVLTLVADAIIAWHGSWIAVAVAMALLAAMLALLLTTPANAIVLPRKRSERIIFGGMAGLVATAAVKGGDARAAIAISAAFIVALSLMRFIVRATNLSAWWLAIAAWNPLVLLTIRG